MWGGVGSASTWQIEREQRGLVAPAREGKLTLIFIFIFYDRFTELIMYPDSKIVSGPHQACSSGPGSDRTDAIIPCAVWAGWTWGTNNHFSNKCPNITTIWRHFKWQYLKETSFYWGYWAIVYTGVCLWSMCLRHTLYLHCVIYLAHNLAENPSINHPADGGSPPANILSIPTNLMPKRR